MEVNDSKPADDRAHSHKTVNCAIVSMTSERSLVELIYFHNTGIKDVMRAETTHHGNVPLLCQRCFSNKVDVAMKTRSGIGGEKDS